MLYESTFVSLLRFRRQDLLHILPVICCPERVTKTIRIVCGVKLFIAAFIAAFLLLSLPETTNR